MISLCNRFSSVSRMWERYTERKARIWQSKKAVGAGRQCTKYVGCMGDEEKHARGTVHLAVANMREPY